MRGHPMVAALLLLLAAPLAAQEDSLTRALVERVGPASAVAGWLVQYDRVAWISSDSVLAADPALLEQLGPEWFCDTVDGRWHAFYGRFDPAADHYRIVFHYEGGDGRPLRSSTAPVDSSRLTGVARALHHTYAKLPPPFAEGRVRLNWYVRRLPGDGVGVTFLPAYQPNGVLVFGGEGHFLWDRTGRQLLDSTYLYTGFRGIRPDTTVELTIPAPELEQPSIGQLFFLLSYHTWFRKLTIRTRYGLTTVFVGADGEPNIITTVHDPEPVRAPS